MILPMILFTHRFTLGPMEEISLVLEDNSMNLQSMSASPFIGPFMATVQKWEKCLTLVSEIIEEWLVTQRKWLYLEGIFIGGDIRDQLPEEAKKFDDIDKAFRRVNGFQDFCWHGDVQVFILNKCIQPFTDYE